jgi:antitoxin HicB
MKTINEYLALPYRMEIIADRDEGGYVVSFPELPGCITCGETMESAIANAEDAKREWITAALEEGITIHEPDNLENYSGQFKLRIPKSLHRSLMEHARREGISMNQYCVYLLSKNDAINSKMNLDYQTP